MFAAAMALTTAFRRAPFDWPLWRELRPAADPGTAPPWDADGSGPAVLLVPGFMAGDASLPHADQLALHREVDTTHCGMVASSTVLDHILTTLAVTPAERNLSLC